MSTRTQLLRFVMVGAASNLALYLVYLLVTALGVDYRTAVTALYVLGVVQTFVLNKRWSFRHSGSHRAAFARYAAVYAFAYFVNMWTLSVLVDGAGLPHQVVQGVMIIVVALFLFAAQKYWVFSKRGRRRNDAGVSA